VLLLVKVLLVGVERGLYSSLALPGVGSPDRNDGFVAVADDVADVLACAGLLWIARHRC